MSLLGATGCVLTLALPVAATVVRDAPAKKAPAPEAAETGGQRVVPSGPLRLACTQLGGLGGTIVDERRLRHVAVPLGSVLGAISFQRPGEGGRTLVLPLGDGSTTCVLSPEPDYVRRAAAALKVALAENRAASWSSARSRASGRVEPIRTFTDAEGRTCRDFTQTIRVGGRTTVEGGTSCEREGGAGWRLPR